MITPRQLNSGVKRHRVDDKTENLLEKEQSQTKKVNHNTKTYEMDEHIISKIGSPSVMFLHGSLTGPNLFSGPLSLLEKKGLSAAALKIEYPKCLNENLSRPQLQHLESECIKSLEEVNASEKLTIVGHGCGSVLALWLAYRFPAKIKKLVLWGVPLPTGRELREAFDNDKEEILTAASDLEFLLEKVNQPVLCLAGDQEKFQFSTLKSASLLKNGVYIHLGPAGSNAPVAFLASYTDHILDFLGSN